MTILSETFEYRDGVLFWRNSAIRSSTGRAAGGLSTPNKRTGRQVIEVRWLGKVFQAHRLIWELHNGPIPTPYEIDHIDGNSLNNRIDNLRLATRQENQRNVGLTSSNTTGFKGVSMFSKSGKFRSDIRIGNKTKYLGQFETPEEAHKAYVSAAKKLHGEFYRCDCQYCSPR